MFPLCLNSLISTARSEEVKDRHRHRHRQRQRHTADTGTGTGTGTGTDTVTAPTRSMAQSKSIIVNPKFLVLGLSIPRPLCSAFPACRIWNLPYVFTTLVRLWLGMQLCIPSQSRSCCIPSHRTNNYTDTMPVTQEAAAAEEEAEPHQPCCTPASRVKGL